MIAFLMYFLYFSPFDDYRLDLDSLLRVFYRLMTSTLVMIIYTLWIFNTYNII